MAHQTRRYHPTARARRLRRNCTDAERALWSRLRDRTFGVKWRRQAPIGPYITDFASHQARIVVEVDGAQHAEQVSDLARDDWLTVQGYRVLRFWNDDVLLRIEDVLDAIEAAVEAR
jgi:very-short-patch-repair endonuclease